MPEAPAYLKAGYSEIICRAFPFSFDHATRGEQPTEPEGEGWGTLPLVAFFFSPLHLSFSLVTCSVFGRRKSYQAECAI